MKPHRMQYHWVYCVIHTLNNNTYSSKWRQNTNFMYIHFRWMRSIIDQNRKRTCYRSFHNWTIKTNRLYDKFMKFLYTFRLNLFTTIYNPESLKCDCPFPFRIRLENLAPPCEIRAPPSPPHLVGDHRITRSDRKESGGFPKTSGPLQLNAE